jgi:hypothetical protein
MIGTLHKKKRSATQLHIIHYMVSEVGSIDIEKEHTKEEDTTSKAIASDRKCIEK